MLKHYPNSNVRIYSNEHNAYWGPNYCGYTQKGSEAGIYKIEDAYRKTSHCGPKKQIMFEIVK